MSPRRNILAFAGLSTFYFCLLTIPWPGPWAGPVPHLMDAYRWAFRTVGNTLFVRTGDGGSVKFSPKSRALHEADTTLRFTSLRTNKGGTGEIKAIYTGYRPTAFLAALILATPIPWRRRGLSLLGGLLLVSGFVAVRVWLRLAVAMGNNDAIQAYVFSGWFKGFLGALNAVFTKSPAVGYMVPAMIWIVVTLRREDWARFGIRLGADDSPSRPAAAAPAPRG